MSHPEAGRCISRPHLFPACRGCLVLGDTVDSIKYASSVDFAVTCTQHDPVKILFLTLIGPRITMQVTTKQGTPMPGIFNGPVDVTDVCPGPGRKYPSWTF